jgi:hypothetical protein
LRAQRRTGHRKARIIQNRTARTNRPNLLTSTSNSRDLRRGRSNRHGNSSDSPLSHRNGLPSNRDGLPSNRDGLPSNRDSLPSNSSDSRPSHRNGLPSHSSDGTTHRSGLKDGLRRSSAQRPAGQKKTPGKNGARHPRGRARRSNASGILRGNSIWQQRGGYNGYRIPGDRFRGYFGPEHGFRIEGLPFMVVGGYPRFEYDGYWLSVVDPWPSNWGDDWYDNDQVYVAYVDNGYYLYNRSYPGVGIAVSISM